MATTSPTAMVAMTIPVPRRIQGMVPYERLPGANARSTQLNAFGAS